MSAHLSHTFCIFQMPFSVFKRLCIRHYIKSIRHYIKSIRVLYVVVVVGVSGQKPGQISPDKTPDKTPDK